MCNPNNTCEHMVCQLLAFGAIPTLRAWRSGEIRGIFADRIWELNGSDGVAVELEASEGLIQSIMEGSEIATLRQRVWG